MKIRRRSLVYVCGLILLTVGPCLAQQQSAAASDLKEQIRKLEAAERDPAMPPEAKTLTDGFLNERRAQLRAALQKKVDALRKYQLAVKDSLTAEENRLVAETIRDLEAELHDLDGVGRGSAAASRSAQAVASTPSPSESLNASAPVLSAAAMSSPEAGRAAPATPAPQATPVTPVNPATCNGAADSYTDAPPLLRDAVERIADDIISGAQQPADAVSALFPDMFFYTVAHAVEPAVDTSVSSIKSLKAYQYLGETARTDKQVGASAKAAGTTSAIEKPGFARLLGFAVENGAILQEVDKTSLTLSTSPYMLYTFTNGGDTAENYQRAGVLNRIGLSATFNLNNQDNPLANATRSQLSEWSVKARLYGDRSTRTKAFQEFWRKPGGPQEAIEGRLRALTNSYQATTPGAHGARPDFDPFIHVDDDITAVVAALVASPSYTGASDADKKRLLTNAILCVLRNEVYVPITSGATPIDQPHRDIINNQLVPSIAAALKNIDFVRGLLKNKLDEVQKGPLATFSYVNHRQTTGSDYSEAKFLFEEDNTMLRPLKLVANVGTSFYHKPDRTLNQEKVRDFSAALSFEGSFDNPLLKETADMSQITVAFTGSYQRTLENRRVAGKKADIGSFQFKLEVPIFAGVSLPFSVTYSNATEEERKKRVRANFGLSFDADKMFAITRLMK